MENGNDYILRMDGIDKSFSGIQVLKKVNLQVRKGTVHALMGENGAGKSTLMKILIGMYSPDNGTITFIGETMVLSSVVDSLNKGISMIHQELTAIPNMSVMENVYLGREPLRGKFGWIDKSRLKKDTDALFKVLGINIDPAEKMKNLSIANKQMVEIAKAISYNSDLIIMDEPTSAISDKEVTHLFKIIRKLTLDGITIIYISHKLEEIFKIADEITVLRDGEFIDVKPVVELTNERLIHLMAGRKLDHVFEKESSNIGEVALSVRNLSKEGKYQNISFDVRKGEVLGIAGLMGAGRSEVVESIFGVTLPDSGEILIKGHQVSIKSPKDAIKNGIGFLTEDRKQTGLFPPLSVNENMTLVSLSDYIRRGVINTRKTNLICEQEIKRLSIKTESSKKKIKYLSGGNQQKVLLARWLLNDPDILILDEPTRGIDVGTKFEIYNLISKLASNGKTIILISSELPELLGLSDRIITMHEGRITGELNRKEATQEKLLKLATK